MKEVLCNSIPTITNKKVEFIRNRVNIVADANILRCI